MKNSCLLLVMTLFAVLSFVSCEAPANTDPGFTYEDWEASTMPETLIEALAWLSAHAVRGRTYTIVVKADETIPSQYMHIGMNGATIILKGDGVERTIEPLNEWGSLFSIYGYTLILDANITLRGNSSSTGGALVSVSNGGILEMRAGAKITGNTAASYSRGVDVYSGTFIMNGGVISGNTGSGVSISSSTSYTVDGVPGSVNSGTFTMNGGEISGNSSGVSVGGGTFTMNGGEISGNTGSGVSVNAYSYSDSSGYSSNSTFTMNGGAISENTGGGVSVSSNGTFTMNDGEISGNTAGYGGGVSVSGSGNSTFIMNDGEISGNTADYGGGVSVSGGTFIMNDGEISGNNNATTDTYGGGGGVYVSYDSTFTMTGGVISHVRTACLTYEKYAKVTL